MSYLLFVMNFSQKCLEVSGQLENKIQFQQTPWKCRMVVHHDRWLEYYLFCQKTKVILGSIQYIFCLSFRKFLKTVTFYHSTVKEGQVPKGCCVIVLKPGDYRISSYSFRPLNSFRTFIYCNFWISKFKKE